MANRSIGCAGGPRPVVAADAAAAAGSPCAPLDGAGRPMRSARPFCASSPSAVRGVTARLSLSLEARALSDEAGWPADEELGETAVVLPVSVANPISVSKESVLGDSSMSEMLDSDMFGPLVASTGGLVWLLWPQPPSVCFCLLGRGLQTLLWLLSRDAFYNVSLGRTQRWCPSMPET